MTRLLPCLAVFAFLLFPLGAQDLRRIQPPSAPPAPGASNVQPEAAAPAVAGNPEEVIAPRLEGLYLTADPKAKPPAGTKGVAWDPALAIPDKAAVEKALRPMLGQPFRVKDMAAVIVAVQRAYAFDGLPFSRVVVPEQEVEHGVVTFVVVSAKVGKMTWRGENYYGDEAYGGALQTRAGSPLNKPILDQDLDWIGRSGYRSVEVTTLPGAAFGTTDLVLQAREKFPLSGSLSYQDSGQELTGEDQWAAVIEWENPLGQHLSYQETDDSEFRLYSGHAGTYDIPLPWRHLVHVNGTYASISPNLPAGFNSANYAWQTGATYEVPFAVVRLGDSLALTQSVQGGFEFKETNNNLLFGGIPVTDNTTQILEWNLLYSARLDDPYGTTTAAANFVYDPGDWTSENTDAAFQGSRAGAKAAFAYGTVQLGRTTPLPWGFSHSVNATVQWADQNLLGSEQLGLGGYATVRGYDEALVYGDEGYVVRNELGLPAFSLSQFFAPKFGTNIAGDRFAPYLFYDRGEVSNKHLLAGEVPNTKLSSVGLGFRYQISHFVSVRFDYGWQLDDPNIPTTDTNARGHFAITASY